MTGPSSLGGFSEQDISTDLKELNLRLHGASRYMADCLKQEFRVGNATEERVAAVQRVSDCIGSALGTSLGMGAPDDISDTLLRIAFQACLASALYRIVSANLNNDTDQNSLRAGE